MDSGNIRKVRMKKLRDDEEEECYAVVYDSGEVRARREAE